MEYEAVFTALEIAAQPGDERQRGDEIIAAEEPDYKDIIEKARAVLEQSHDLRAAVYLASAETRRNGLSGFAETTSYIRGCLEDFWDTCHPQLDEDDDDPTMRVNAVAGLSASDFGGSNPVLDALRNAPMTQSNAFGRITLRDMQIQDGEVTPGEDETVKDTASVSAAFKDTDPEVLSAFLASARQALEDVKAIDQVFNERIPGLGPELSLLQKSVARIVARLADEVGEPEVEVAEESADSALSAAPVVGGGVGGIGSTRDVLNAIDRIIDYYSKTEPSSPVPIFLARAKRLVGADFMTIMSDVAPMGVDNVKLIGGINESTMPAPTSSAGSGSEESSDSSGW